jgi:hypothetical protein
MRSNRKEASRVVDRHGTQQRQGSGQARNIGGTVWHNVVGWVREESAAASALVLAFIALGIAFEWWHWSPAQTGAVVGIVAALLGMFVRSQVTPIYRLKPGAGQPGAPGPGVSNRRQDELDSGVRVLPGTAAGAGPAGRPEAGTAGGPPPGPGAGQAPRPNTGPPGPQPARPDAGPPTRPDVGPPARPDVPPGFPEPGRRQ